MIGHHRKRAQFDIFKMTFYFMPKYQPPLIACDHSQSHRNNAFVGTWVLVAFILCRNMSQYCVMICRNTKQPIHNWIVGLIPSIGPGCAQSDDSNHVAMCVESPQNKFLQILQYAQSLSPSINPILLIVSHSNCISALKHPVE